MRKGVLLFISFCLIFGIFAAAPAVSQSADTDESDIYYFNIPILRIYPHKLGYYIIYRRPNLKQGSLYIPNEWFDRRDQRAVINRVDNTVNPYISVFMRNKEFDHIRLYISKNIRHPSWGTIPNSAIPAEKFQVETLELEF
ncbi:hypothetical protein K7I13_15155 [Brucepastera parasyntrophica]|uniref:hypothetical protein n=1 Tax=Brucepastera parasyntrophica TaxID=2880008 RepID=UPI002108633F|nr:hypothetical protein [Brucepastera parasyntrophica]ULQ59765.1 hypothetical protein K7I13_15155 [Brucepastera parasyntrophica]